MPVVTPAGRRTAAVLGMVGGTASFVFADAMMKLTSGQFPVGQSIFVRGLFGLALLQIFMLARGAKVSRKGSAMDTPRPLRAVRRETGR